MQTSLAKAREEKTDFTPRSGGNSYKVIKAETAAAPGASGETVTAKKGASANLDFLLARALQTTIQDHKLTSTQQ